MTSPNGVLLVGHGTRDAAGTDEFFALSDRLAEILSDRPILRDNAIVRDSAIVRPCLLEFQKPDIADAYASLMQSGCRDVIVAPLLLFSAGHAKSDIPDEVEAARATWETRIETARTGESQFGSESSLCDWIRIRYAKPITRQAAMIEAVRTRLTETLRQTRLSTGTTVPERTRTAIVMVGRGSRDPCATTDMRVLSETAVRGRHAEGSIADDFDIARDGLFTTFYAMAEPRLPETLEHAAAGGFDRIVVHPHLLFSGRLYDAIVSQVNVAIARHPHIRFDVSAYLGPTSAVAIAIAARIEDARSGKCERQVVAPLDARYGRATISLDTGRSGESR